jgi:hypothetical protein
MHFMIFGYDEYVGRVLELADLAERRDLRQYEFWTPYRLQGAPEG